MTYDPQNPYDRTRVTDLWQTTFVSFRQTRSGTPDWNDGPYAKWKQGVYKSIQDQRHRNFSRRFAIGEPIFGNLYLLNSERRTDYAVCKTSYVYGGKDCTYQATGDLAGYWENSGSHLAKLLAVSAEDVNRMTEVALINAYAKVNQYRVNSLEILATMDQTVSMLRRPFRGALELTRKMLTYRQKRLGKTANSVTKATADAWLEYRYGWKPLLIDADNICEMAAKGLSKKERRVARATQNLSFNTTSNFTQALGPTWLKASGSCTQNNSVQVSAGVFFDVVNQKTSDQVLASFGLRPRDIPSVGWELLPFSFVVDWFTNVGPFLQAVVPAPGIHILGNWVTVKNVMSKQTTVRDFTIIADGVWRPGTGTANSSVSTTSVKRLCDLPLPNAPGLTTESLSTLRSADGVSLLAQKVLTGLAGMRH